MIWFPGSVMGRRAESLADLVGCEFVRFKLRE